VTDHVADGRPDLEVLRTVERRVLWLATRIIDHANRRPTATGSDVKVGGHQASSASIASIMTALWFGHLSGEDKVAVKPHAAPVYHAIKYLTGELDRSYLTTLRQRGGLQAYPSRTKDPDVADFSTGSVGLGAVAPLFSALTRRYVDSHVGGLPPARFFALVGDAELDEGNVWEAIADPATQGLGNFTMVVDLNRQSLDRVIPDIAAIRLERFFEDAGWHVAEAKYGRRLSAAFADRTATHCAPTSTPFRTRRTNSSSRSTRPTRGTSSWPEPTPPCGTSPIGSPTTNCSGSSPISVATISAC
jgi:pyruvate dehydrogenase E1 component